LIVKENWIEYREAIVRPFGNPGLSPHQLAETTMQLIGIAGEIRLPTAVMVLGTTNGGTGATVIHHLLMAT
jgi:hypothetical protein